MKKVTITLIALLIFKCTLFSQTAEPARGVEKKTLQIELESIYSVQKENSSTIKSWSIPNLLLRYGLLKNLEMQFNVPLIREKLIEHDALIYTINKFHDIQIGFSLNLWAQNKWIPETAFLYRSVLHSKPNLQFLNVDNVYSINFSNNLNEKLTLSNNIGYATEKTSGYTRFIVSNLDYSYSSKTNFLIEYSCNDTKESGVFQNITIGVGYALNKNITLEYSVAKGINHNLFYTGGRLTYVIESFIN